MFKCSLQSRVVYNQGGLQVNKCGKYAKGSGAETSAATAVANGLQGDAILRVRVLKRVIS